MFTYINKRQSDFAISRGFYFHETSHMQSFAKIKSSRKFPNLQYFKVTGTPWVGLFVLIRIFLFPILNGRRTGNCDIFSGEKETNVSIN